MRFIKVSDLKFPKRKINSHKGDNGKVLVVGGSQDYVGAVALAGLAVLRTGADLVTVIAPEKVAWAINCLTPDLITKKVKGDYFKLNHSNKVKTLFQNFDVILIGNGLGLKRETMMFVQEIVKTPNYKVIDADGIKAITTKITNTIITPHNRELEIFLINSGQKELVDKIKNRNIKKKALLIKKYLNKFLQDNIILLKGRIDIIISDKDILYNKTGNPGMTKAGTGDVLAGLCAGFLAQLKNLKQAAINAAYINGIIGDLLLKEKKGYSYIASDIVKDIKHIIKRLKTKS